MHAGYLRLQKRTQNMKHLLPSHCNNGCTNAPQCYVTRTQSSCELFRAFKRSRRQCAVTVVICCVKMRCSSVTQRPWHFCPLESDGAQFGTCVMFRKNLPLPSLGPTKHFQNSCSGSCGWKAPDGGSLWPRCVWISRRLPSLTWYRVRCVTSLDPKPQTVLPKHRHFVLTLVFGFL